MRYEVQGMIYELYEVFEYRSTRDEVTEGKNMVEPIYP